MFSQPPELGLEGRIPADEGHEQRRQWEGRWGLGCGVFFHRAQTEAGAGALTLSSASSARPLLTPSLLSTYSGKLIALLGPPRFPFPDLDLSHVFLIGIP